MVLRPRVFLAVDEGWTGESAVQVKWNERKERYYGDVTIDGARYRPDLGTPSEAIAQRRLAEWTVAKRKELAEEAKKKPWTVSDAVDLYMRDVLKKKSTHLKPKTRKRYITSLIHVVTFFKDWRVDDVGARTLYDYEQHRLEQPGRSGAGVTGQTILNDFVALSRVFAHARMKGFASSNPVLPYVEDRRENGELKGSKPRRRYLSMPEETLLLSAAEGMMRAAITLSIDTGLRYEELISRKWSHIDLAAKEIHVTAEAAKTETSERTVPLLPRAIRTLMALPHCGEYVLWHGDGDRYVSMQQMLYRLCDKVGIEGLCWHDLRRTCGCRLLQDHGMPMEIVSRWLGHSSLGTTERHYAFLRKEDLHGAVARSRVVD